MKQLLTIDENRLIVRSHFSHLNYCFVYSILLDVYWLRHWCERFLSFHFAHSFAPFAVSVHFKCAVIVCTHEHILSKYSQVSFVKVLLNNVNFLLFQFHSVIFDLKSLAHTLTCMCLYLCDIVQSTMCEERVH